MPKIQFTAQSSRDDDNEQVNTSRLINCYLEPTGGRSPMVMKSVLGMRSFASIPGVFTRAATEVGDLVYVIHGSALHRINSNGIVTLLATIPDSVETTISSNDGNVTIVADGRYFVWDGASLSEPATGAFSDFQSVTYFGSLTVLGEKGGNRVQWSDVFDPATLDGLSFATADYLDDKIVRIEAVAGSLWVLKEGSIERWFQDGADLAPVGGAAVEYGLKALPLFGRIPNGAFFVTSENKVRLLLGGAQVISSRGVETALAQSTPTHCFFYQDEGHDICVIRFSDRPAWCYDIATGLWHERSEGQPGDPWSVVSTVKAFGKWYAITELGDMYSLERTNGDYGNPLIRQATGETYENDGDRFRIASIEAYGRVGQDNANVTLEMSKDFGKTWGDPKVRKITTLGRHGDRIIWRSLGQYRKATARLTWSDPVETPIDNTVSVKVA